MSRPAGGAAARRAFAGAVKLDLLRFAEFDRDGNAELDFDEFCAMLPAALLSSHSRDETRRLFDEADRDGDGVLTGLLFFSGQ